MKNYELYRQNINYNIMVRTVIDFSDTKRKYENIPNANIWLFWAAYKSHTANTGTFSFLCN